MPRSITGGVMSILTDDDYEGGMGSRRRKSLTSTISVVVHDDDEPTIISITGADTFESLTRIILEDRIELYGTLPWAIVFAFVSSIRRRAMFRPAQNALVLKSVLQEEARFPGQIVLHFTAFHTTPGTFALNFNKMGSSTDSRKKANSNGGDDYGNSITDGSPTAAGAHQRKNMRKLVRLKSIERLETDGGASTKSLEEGAGGSSTLSVAEVGTGVSSGSASPANAATAARRREIEGPYQNESASQKALFQIMESCVKMGPLIRKVQGEEEVLYAYLDATRLWYYVIGGSSAVLMQHTFRKSPDLAMLSYVDIPKDAVITDKGPGTHAFMVSNLGDTFMPYEGDHLHLKGRDASEKEDWIAAFEARHLPTVDCGENAMFLQLERQIESNQYSQSKKEADQLARNASFEGMLDNALLRTRFQSYLKDSYISESFMFWEHAEDYRRGNEASKKPFPFHGGSQPSTPPQTHLWAQNIYENFIATDAPQQVSEVPVDMAAEISRKIAQAGQGGPSLPAWDIFEDAQRLSYQKLKFSEGHYSAFIALPMYRNILMASLHYQERNQSGLRTLATALTDNRHFPSVMGHVGEGVDGEFVHTATLSEAPRGFLSRAFSWSKTSSVSANESATRVSAQSQPSRLVRAVSWRSEKSHPKYLPRWWWAFVHVEPPPSEVGARTGARGEEGEGGGDADQLRLQTAAGLLAEYDSRLVDSLERAIHAANAQRARRAAALLQQRIALRAGNSWVGHAALSRLYSDMHCTTSSHDGDSMRQGGLYGTVLLTGLIRCHHVEELQQEGSGVWNSFRTVATPTGAGGSSRRMSYVPQSASLSFTGGESPVSPSPRSAKDGLHNTMNSNASYDVFKVRFERFYAVVTYFNGFGRLFLFDESSHRLLSRIRLDLITGIAVSNRVLNGVELYEGQGRSKHCVLVFVAQCVDQAESTRVAQRWIDHIHPFCHRECTVVRFAFYGMMSKRGVTNSAWQPRYFVLTSLPSLSYYRTNSGWASEDVPGSSHKGDIDLAAVTSKDVFKSPANELELCIQTADRVYYVLCKDAQECSMWRGRVAEVLDCSGRRSMAPAEYEVLSVDLLPVAGDANADARDVADTDGQQGLVQSQAGCALPAGGRGEEAVAVAGGRSSREGWRASERPRRILATTFHAGDASASVEGRVDLGTVLGVAAASSIAAVATTTVPTEGSEVDGTTEEQDKGRDTHYAAAGHSTEGDEEAGEEGLATSADQIPGEDITARESFHVRRS